MGLKRYVLLLLAIGAVRLVELRLSRRHQRTLASRGVVMAPDPHFRWMVVLHVGVLAGSAIEVSLKRRAWFAPLGVPMAGVLLGANLLRWWVIRTMADHWNVRVMDSMPLGVVSTGPFRWIRHPNYVAIFLELLAIPLLHGAWITALVGCVAHLWVLGKRLAVEDPILMASPDYRATMAWKPRFIPAPFAEQRARSCRWPMS
jgi:methyltransferase